jgi:hypothetical protein
MENWIWIQGYKYDYYVSDKGNVTNRHGKVLTPVLDKDGYFRIRLVDSNGVRKFRAIHRLVAQYFIGHHCFDTMTVNHKDGNKQNNIAENLEIITNSENIKHAYANNLKNNKGEAHGKARFTEVDINNIRDMYANGKKQVEIAKLFKTTQPRIYEIVNRITWSHL